MKKRVIMGYTNPRTLLPDCYSGIRGLDKIMVKYKVNSGLAFVPNHCKYNIRYFKKRYFLWILLFSA
jgi:hypothetical protein